MSNVNTRRVLLQLRRPRQIVQKPQACHEVAVKPDTRLSLARPEFRDQPILHFEPFNCHSVGIVADKPRFRKLARCQPMPHLARAGHARKTPCWCGKNTVSCGVYAYSCNYGFLKDLHASTRARDQCAPRAVACICLFLKDLLASKACFTAYLWFSKGLSRIGPRILLCTIVYRPCYQ